MTRIRASHIASITEFREPAKVFERTNGNTVAILKNSAVVGYYVPVEAMDTREHRVATREEVMAHLEESRERVQPVLDYLRDK